MDNRIPVDIWSRNGLCAEAFVRSDAKTVRGPCWCGGTRRLLVFLDNLYYRCDKCAVEGFLSDNGSEYHPAPAVDKAPDYTKVNFAHCRTWEVYALCPDLSYWLSEGIPEESVRKFGLGLCQDCPMYPGHKSHTIPVWEYGKLVNIRHRIINPENPKDKYRPHIPGLGNHMFNSDILSHVDSVVVVEGEKKAIVLDAQRIATVAIPGASSFKGDWASRFKHLRAVWVALDPGMEAQSLRIARLIGDAARICNFPTKPDDFLVKYGGSRQDFLSVLSQAKRVTA